MLTRPKAALKLHGPNRVLLKQGPGELLEERKDPLLNTPSICLLDAHPMLGAQDKVDSPVTCSPTCSLIYSSFPCPYYVLVKVTGSYAQ